MSNSIRHAISNHSQYNDYFASITELWASSSMQRTNELLFQYFNHEIAEAQQEQEIFPSYAEQNQNTTSKAGGKF